MPYLNHPSHACGFPGDSVRQKIFWVTLCLSKSPRGESFNTSGQVRRFCSVVFLYREHGQFHHKVHKKCRISCLSSIRRGSKYQYSRLCCYEKVTRISSAEQLNHRNAASYPKLQQNKSISTPISPYLTPCMGGDAGTPIDARMIPFPIH